TKLFVKVAKSYYPTLKMCTVLCAPSMKCCFAKPLMIYSSSADSSPAYPLASPVASALCKSSSSSAFPFSADSALWLCRFWEMSGEDICSNPEVSNPGCNMSINCSCLRMMPSFRRSALMNSFLEGSGELGAEGVGTSIGAAGGGTGGATSSSSSRHFP
ncbi:hypothetical protein PIB30_096783, partial [Stylosanthes scabra]|nr:hypothetical protein [Stylosanthes scabra]